MRSLLFLLLLSALFTEASALHAAEEFEGSPAVAQADQPVPTPEEPSADEPLAFTAEGISESLKELKAKAIEADKLSEETRTEVAELCDKALAKIAEKEKLEAAAAALQKELDEAGEKLESLQKESSEIHAEPSDLAQLNAEELRGKLSAADLQVSSAREKVQKVAAEIERRAARRLVLPDLLAKCREQLDKNVPVQKEAAASVPPLLKQARGLYQAARLSFLQQELQWLEQENRTYEATGRLSLAKRDAAEKQLQLASEQLKHVQELNAKSQRIEAKRQATEARRTAVNAHPAVKEAATLNAVLAEKNQTLVRRMQLVAKRIAAARELGQTMKRRLGDVKKQAEFAENSPAIGVMLRSQQDQMPELGSLRERLRTRPLEISQLSLDVYEWEVQRNRALNVDKAVEEAVVAFEASSSDTLPEEVIAELRLVLNSRVEILAELFSNSGDCVTDLEKVNTEEAKVVKVTEELQSFIAEQVLWVRSAPTLSLEDVDFTNTFWSSVPGRLNQTKQLVANLLADAKQNSHWWAMATCVTLVLLVGRRKVRSILRANGELAAKPSATLFRPTIVASLATLFLAATVPVVCGFIGWRLCRTSDGFACAAGWSLVWFAAAYAMLNLVRHASRSSGLGTNHFGWDARALSAIRHSMRSLELIALPLLAIAVGVEIAGDEQTINSIGRLSLISALVVIGVICFRLLRPRGPLASSLASTSKNSWRTRFVSLIPPLATLAILGLLAATISGYHYTAMQLTRRVFGSCVFVFAFLALRSLLMRWLLVSYRRVAIQQARAKRKALLEAQESKTADQKAVEVETHFNLGDINQQARNLVGVGVGLAFAFTMLWNWSEVLPALGVLDHVELWTSGLAPSDSDVGTVFVTLADVLLAFGIFGFTWFAGRNLPGLLEIAVLQKLPLDAGARYAASSVTRYMIMVVGIALGVRQLGVGWQSVQWLVAAMTVGLGFGLQEIFANFVSGIILLFERPARVGDTVTIGEITGTVTKIRIRATTIVDWDNKELIVPNKDFITGNLVNWTLTTPSLRLIVKVGIAYGSDTRLATKLLYQVATENPNVLASPEPFVMFDAFGESSLNFELRVFVNDLTMYRRLKHDLHLLIDDLFKQHNIEIAFPQCDLHLKTLPAAAHKIFAGATETHAQDPENIAA
ncbi:mechanosensitive ion channel domain-containing protein [Adhaeretor mobilis]|nr:mechanosensitive ion channel domain-containing protein [Adhaeretor mobilis]